MWTRSNEEQVTINIKAIKQSLRGLQTGGGLKEKGWDARPHAEHWPWMSCDGGNGSGW